MHRQLAAGSLFQTLTYFIAVHRPTGALQKSQDYQRSRACVQLLLEFPICRLSFHFSLISGPSIDDCYVLISYL